METDMSTVRIDEEIHGNYRHQIGRSSSGATTFLYAAPVDSAPLKLSSGGDEKAQGLQGEIRPFGINS